MLRRREDDEASVVEGELLLELEEEVGVGGRREKVVEPVRSHGPWNASAFSVEVIIPVASPSTASCTIQSHPISNPSSSLPHPIPAHSSTHTHLQPHQINPDASPLPPHPPLPHFLPLPFQLPIPQTSNQSLRVPIRNRALDERARLELGREPNGQGRAVD